MKIPQYKILVILFILSISGVSIPASGLWAQENPSKEQEAIFVAKKAYEDGFYEVSLGLLERFLKNYPNSSKTQEAQLLIGQCYFQQNKFIDALEKFEWLLKQGLPSDVKVAVLYWTAEVHFKGGNFTKAATYYQQIVDDFPKSSFAADAYYSLGWCLFEERAFVQAIEYFKTVAERFPDEPLAQESAFKIIECLYYAKDYSGLIEKAQAYLKAYPRDAVKAPYLYFYLAEAGYYLNDFKGALAAYEEVIKSCQDAKILVSAKIGLGWVYLKLKRYDEAENLFEDIKLESLDKANRDTLLLGKAILASEEKKFDKAIAVYEDLLKSSEDHLALIQAYLGKADSLYSLARYKEAIDAYAQGLENCVRQDPQEITDKLHYGLAWSNLKEGRFKEAISEFQKIAKQSDDKILKISALCQVGDAYQDSGDWKKAIETYDAVLKDYPDSFYSDYVQYQLGVCLLKTSNYDGAILAFQALKNNFPNSKLLDDATYALGLSYFQRENYTAAREVFDGFQQEYKESGLRAQGMYLLGTSLYNLGKFPEAIEVYKNVIRQYNQDSELAQKAEYEIADCYSQMGNEKEAMSRFKMLRAKYPNSSLTPEIIWWLGEYYYRNNDFELARRYFLSLIQDFPKSNLIPNAYYAIGSIYQEEADYPQAIENFKKAKELGKTDLAAQAAIASADIYLKEGQADLALSAYEDVVKEYPNLADLIYPKIGDIYQVTGNEDKAIEFYRKSLEIVPMKEMGGIQLNIAEALEAKGKVDEAVEEYLKVNYLYGQDSALGVKALLRVAAIYEDKKKYKEAQNIYKQIIAMNIAEGKYAQERIDWIKANTKHGE